MVCGLALFQAGGEATKRLKQGFAVVDGLVRHFLAGISPQVCAASNAGWSPGARAAHSIQERGWLWQQRAFRHNISRVALPGETELNGP